MRSSVVKIKERIGKQVDIALHVYLNYYTVLAYTPLLTPSCTFCANISLPCKLCRLNIRNIFDS